MTTVNSGRQTASASWVLGRSKALWPPLPSSRSQGSQTVWRSHTSLAVVTLWSAEG